MSVTSELLDIVNRSLRNRWPGGPQSPSPPGQLAWPGTPAPAPVAPPAASAVPGPAPGMTATPPPGPGTTATPGAAANSLLGIPLRPGQMPPAAQIPRSMARAQNASLQPPRPSLRDYLAGAAGVGAVGAAVPMLGGSEGLGQIRPPTAASGEVTPPPTTTAPPAAPQTAPANAAAPTTQDRYRQELERRAFGGGGGGGFRPREITPDMMPNWQLVRDANAAARPEAPEQMSDEDMRRNVLLAFLGSFEQRPGERLGAAFARQGGAAGRARTGAEEQNRQTRDVTRRELQAYRQGQAALEAQIQTGQSRSIIDMIRANNEAQLQAAQLAAAGSGRSLQALLALREMDDPTRRVSPDYATSRVVQAALDSRNPMPIPGLDIAAARQAALNSQEWLNLPQTERGLTNFSGQPNPALQALMARQLRAQIDALLPEQRAALLQSFRPLFTTRPPASARVGE
jgi:hypothetical protein